MGFSDSGVLGGANVSKNKTSIKYLDKFLDYKHLVNLLQYIQHWQVSLINF